MTPEFRVKGDGTICMSLDVFRSLSHEKLYFMLARATPQPTKTPQQRAEKTLVLAFSL